MSQTAATGDEGRLQAWAHEGLEAVEGRLGGPARTRVIVLLACILGLDSADKGATGALAPQLEAAFHVGNVEIGLLVAISSLVGAVATLPFGVLADRARRNRVLVVAVVCWSVAEAASALSTSFVMLLLLRVGLGIIVAVAGPFVASLTGDLFPTKQRSRIFGYVVTGELMGAGIGLIISGDVASALGWRYGYAVLAIPSLALAWALWRYLPEPARGGQSWLAEGQEEIPSVEEVEAHPEAYPDPEELPVAARENPVLEQVEEQGIDPDPSTVLHGDPQRISMWEAVRWVLRVRTNVVLIVASALGYFFFGGLRAFAVLYVRGRYGISESESTALVVIIGAAAVGGILVWGHLSDRFLGRGRMRARIWMGAIAYIVSAVVFFPGILSSALFVSLPIFLVAAFFVAAPNPPVDAARLDVIPSRMWGRAEAIRTFVRTILEAFAPLLFGYVSLLFGAHGVAGFAAGINTTHVHIPPSETHGLEEAFLVMLIPLALSGVLLLAARKRYPVDVASAAQSEEETAGARRQGGEPGAGGAEGGEGEQPGLTSGRGARPPRRASGSGG